MTVMLNAGLARSLFGEACAASVRPLTATIVQLPKLDAPKNRRFEG
jgi:hypothetical protein